MFQYLKKSIFCMLFLFICGTAFSAQTKVGLYGVNQYALNEYSDYVHYTLGTGISFEYGIPFISILSIGISVHLQECAVIATERISSYWSTSGFAGIWLRVPLNRGSLYFQPDISCGAWVHGIKTAEEYQGMSNTAYTDFAFQVTPSFRYIPRFFPGGSLEFAFSPVYTTLIEKSRTLDMLGFQLGIMYTFNNRQNRQRE